MELKQENLSLIKKYPIETLVTFLCVGMAALTTWIYKLDSKLSNTNNQMIQYQMQDRKEMIEVIEKNTEAINMLNYSKMNDSK